MSERRSFQRKVTYGVAIIILLLPLAWLSMPATSGGERQERTAGGKLARLRDEHGLSQANLGKIDPATQTMKLATLGMGGIAANLLWQKSIEYKKKEDWTSFRATLEQVQRVQPNFINVWKFQAWNLSYNISVEFDDYHDRYHWVIEGIKYLQEGERYNQDDPRLLWELGWFIGWKIGRADEQVQYRRLFREDDDFHGDRPRGQRDNWLVGKKWFERMLYSIHNLGKSIGNKAPLLYESNPPMWQINYSEALADDGVFGEFAREAWRQSAEEWHEYGSTSILTSFGTRILLNDLDRARRDAEKYKTQLDEIAAGVRAELLNERLAALSPEERTALDKAYAERKGEEHDLADKAAQKINVTHHDVANRIKRLAPARAKEAEALARKAIEADEQIRTIESYRQQANFDYWKTRCESEQTADAQKARELIYRGDESLADADLVRARSSYEEGFEYWKKVIDAFPSLLDGGDTSDDLIDAIVNYRSILNELDNPFPQDFLLREVIELYDREGKLQDVLEELKASESQAAPGPSATDETDPGPPDPPEPGSPTTPRQ